MNPRPVWLVSIGAEINAENEVPDETDDASSVLRRMNTANNALDVAILDACRNNPYASHFRSRSRGLARIDGPSGSLIAYSTAPGAVAYGVGALGMHEWLETVESGAVYASAGQVERRCNCDALSAECVWTQQC